MILDKMKSMDKDDLLDLVGLETRRSATRVMMPALAMFGVGVLVGTGIGLLVAPRAGRELRGDIANQLKRAPEALAHVPEQIGDAFGGHLPRPARDPLHQATDRVGKVHGPNLP